MSSAPRHDDAQPSRPPITLMKLAEKRALGEPIVMVTAYDHPSAVAVEAAGVDMVLVGDSAANNVLGYPDTVPVTVEELLMLSAAVHRGLKTAAAGRRPPVRLLRGVRRAGDRDRAPLRQGGGLRRRQARGRRRLGRAGARHRPRRRAGDGPRRPDPADRDRARRLPRPGPHRRAGPRGARGRAGAAGGRLLRDRLRGDPRRRHRRDHAVHGGADHRHRRGRRAPTARCSSCTTCWPSTTASSRSSSRSTRRSARRWCAACSAYAEEVRSRAFPGPEHSYGIAPEELDRLRAAVSGKPRSHRLTQL